MIYALVAGAWILLSGLLLDVRIADPARRAAFEYGKGFLFVIVTAGLLWWLVRRALRREQTIAAEREAAMRCLTESERAATVGLLAAGLAHEFNNLHAVADGNLELAQAQVGDDEKLAQRLTAARGALARATGLTRSLLGLSRPGGGERGLVELHRLVNETVDLIRPGLLADGIRIELDLAAVPAVPGDPHQLGQVVMNLLINASHAMHGRPRKLLRLATRHAAAAVELIVADSGCGIAPEHHERLFQPFFTTKDGGDGRPGGTGLGLSVSRALVEAHGGSIAVDSRPGEGAAFTIRLPTSAPIS